MATAKQINEFTTNNFKQGLVQKSDVLNTEVYIAKVESNILKTQSNIATASDFLSILMGAKTSTLYTVEDANNSIHNSSKTISVQRADFMAMQKAIEASDIMIQSSKKSYLPKLNAFGSYQFNDASMFGFSANAYLAGIQLSWNIFKGNKTKNTIATQTIERNKITQELEQQKEQSTLEVAKNLRDIDVANATILQHNKAIEKGSSKPWYFACNSALQLGLLYEDKSEWANARAAYQKAIKIDTEEYSASLHARAKAGYNRVKNK